MTDPRPGGMAAVSFDDAGRPVRRFNDARFTIGKVNTSSGMQQPSGSLEALKQQVSGCYAIADGYRRTNAHGVIRLTVVVDASGRAQRIDIRLSKALQDDFMSNCVEGALRRTLFHASDAGRGTVSLEIRIDPVR